MADARCNRETEGAVCGTSWQATSQGEGLVGEITQVIYIMSDESLEKGEGRGSGADKLLDP